MHMRKVACMRLRHASKMAGMRHVSGVEIHSADGGCSLHSRAMHRRFSLATSRQCQCHCAQASKVEPFTRASVSTLVALAWTLNP